MELLRTHQLVRLHDGEPLFAPLDLTLRHGQRLGLAGPNGAGKSALLDLLAGVAAPDAGQVRRAPGVRLGYLAQGVPSAPAGADVWEASSVGLSSVREAEARMRAEERRLALGAAGEQRYAEAVASFERLGGYGAEAELRRALAVVGFEGDRLALPVDRLSGGERRRLALAGALAGAPEVLLLDEPTNHLDLAMRRWLAGRLARWPGALVLVSHDRALLDAVTRSTLFLGGGAWELRRGSYGPASAARRQNLGALQRRARLREREAERLRAMARELASFGNRGAQRRRRAAERRADALTAGDAADGLAPPLDAPAGTLTLATRGLRGVLLEARHLRRDGVLEVPELRLHAGEHVALLGPNGSGKTSLLRMLAGALASHDPRAELRTPPRLRLTLLGQLDRGLTDGLPVLRQVEALARPERARQLLAEAGLGPPAWDEPPERLSGGQRARAGLALLMAREADVLLLDEPSNDLDLAGVEALEQALRASRATIVVATHDQRLAEALGHVWGLQDGTLAHYGDVAGYLAGRPSRAPVLGAMGSARPLPAAAGPAGLAVEAGAASDGAWTEADDGSPTRADDGAWTPTADHAGTWTPAASFADGAPPALDGRAQAAALRAVGEAEAGRLAALEDERRLAEEVLMDPFRPTERERARLAARLVALDDALALAYDARLAPPAPRFRVREGGLAVFADRTPDGLVVLLPAGADAARPMARLLRALDPAAPSDPGTELPARRPRDLAWVHVRLVAGVAHLALFEPEGACLLPYARTALVEGATRFAFTLTGAGAVQLFCTAPLPGTRLPGAGGGWWSWTRGAFVEAEGWAQPAGPGGSRPAARGAAPEGPADRPARPKPRARRRRRKGGTPP